MDNGIKPATLMLIGGGAVMFIATLLDWRERGGFSVSGWDTDAWGLMGVFVAIIGIVIAVGVAVTTFADVSLPDDILGFSRTQLYVSLAEAAFLINFGQQFASDWGIGILLGWLAAGVAVAGGIIELRSDSGGSAPPTQF